MKFCLVFAATLALAFGTPVSQSRALTSSDKDLEKFINALHKFTDDGEDFDRVNVGVNVLVDDVLEDMREVLKKHHLNVIELRDENVELPEQESHIHLTKGQLEDMASGLRYDEVSVDHDRDNRILSFRVPLGFSDLEFNYEYKTTVDKKENKGEVEGKIGHIKLDLEVAYDAKRGFAVEGVHIHDRGELTVEFSGHSLDVDVIKAITHTVKAHLAPLLEEFTEKHVDEVAGKVVEKINDFIHNHDDDHHDDDHHDDDHDDDHDNHHHHDDDDDNDDHDNHHHHDDDDDNDDHNDDHDNHHHHDDDDDNDDHNDDHDNHHHHDDDDNDDHNDDHDNHHHHDDDDNDDHNDDHDNHHHHDDTPDDDGHISA